MRLIRLASICLACIASSFASDLPATYQQAVDLAEAQYKLPEVQKYSNDILLPIWTQRMGPIFQKCFRDVARSDGGSFSFVMALGPDGKVLRVYVDREADIYPCGLVLKAGQFPAPPQAPYYWQINIRLETPAPRNAAREGQPPFVVDRRYSYMFGLPAGWEVSLPQAHEHGSSLAYFPKGGSFNDSSTVIYVTIFADDCPGGCIPMLPDSVAATLGALKSGKSQLDVTISEPILTKDATRAEIRLVKGVKSFRDPQSTEDEALAFLAHDQAILLVTLSSLDSKTWERDYDAFQQIVAGHMFFPTAPCSAIACGK